MNKRPISLKNKMMTDLKLKKFRANRLKDQVTDFENIVTGLYEICIEGKDMNIKITEKIQGRIQRTARDDNETKINPNYIKLSKSLIKVYI